MSGPDLQVFQLFGHEQGGPHEFSGMPHSAKSLITNTVQNARKRIKVHFMEYCFLRTPIERHHYATESDREKSKGRGVPAIVNPALNIVYIYTVSQKGRTLILTITSADVDQFS